MSQKPQFTILFMLADIGHFFFNGLVFLYFFCVYCVSMTEASVFTFIHILFTLITFIIYFALILFLFVFLKNRGSGLQEVGQKEFTEVI